MFIEYKKGVFIDSCNIQHIGVVGGISFILKSEPRVSMKVGKRFEQWFIEAVKVEDQLGGDLIERRYKELNNTNKENGS